MPSTPILDYQRRSRSAHSLQRYGLGHYVEDPYAPGESTYVIPDVDDPGFNPYSLDSVPKLPGTPGTPYPYSLDSVPKLSEPPRTPYCLDSVLLTRNFRDSPVPHHGQQFVHEEKVLGAVLVLQRRARGWIARSAAIQRYAWVLRLQSTVRVIYHRRCFMIKRRAVTRIAGTFRGHVQKKKFERLCLVARIAQRLLRGNRARRRFQAMPRSALLIQAAWRGKEGRQVASLLRHDMAIKRAAPLIQAAFRGMKDRRLVAHLRYANMSNRRFNAWSRSMDEVIIKSRLNDEDHAVRAAARKVLAGDKTLVTFFRTVNTMKTMKIVDAESCNEQNIKHLAALYETYVTMGMSDCIKLPVKLPVKGAQPPVLKTYDDKTLFSSGECGRERSKTSHIRSLETTVNKPNRPPKTVRYAWHRGENLPTVSKARSRTVAID